MAVFGAKLQLLKPRSATCESCSWLPPLSFWLILRAVVAHTHRYHPSKSPVESGAPRRRSDFYPFRACCLLLAAAAAAAAKPGRSTLDPKKGYKVKTGSTSSVTPTLPTIVAKIIPFNKKNSSAHHCTYPYPIRQCSMQPKHFKSSNKIFRVNCKPSLLAKMDLSYLCTFLTVPFRKNTFSP